MRRGCLSRIKQYSDMVMRKPSSRIYETRKKGQIRPRGANTVSFGTADIDLIGIQVGHGFFAPAEKVGNERTAQLYVQKKVREGVVYRIPYSTGCFMLLLASCPTTDDNWPRACRSHWSPMGANHRSLYCRKHHTQPERYLDSSSTSHSLGSTSQTETCHYRLV